LIKETRSYKKGPCKGKSIDKYIYKKSKITCVSSDGAKTVTTKHPQCETAKQYDATGVLARFTIERKNKRGSYAESWEYHCDCNGVVARPVYQAIRKYKYAYQR